MTTLRVFATKTNACPRDDYSYFDTPPLMLPEDASEVHISCSFTWAQKRAEWLALQWEITGLPVKVGGPAYGDRGSDFMAGIYLRKGITITSRGCNNSCWFCRVWRDAGRLRELPIQDGYQIFDDNLLQCSDDHINAVFNMLSRQPYRPEFQGGIEAAELKPWHVERMSQLKTRRIYFAYDTPDDYEPLVQASKLLHAAWKNPENRCYCYVLCGYRGDTIAKADNRMREVWQLGYTPFAMLYRDETGDTDPCWHKFRTAWARPASARYLLKTGEIQR